jgi:UDP-glucose:(heptosyl)LPS alpha-1,3-glucosyltransferase
MLNIAVITERADISLGGAERSTFELTSELNLLGANTTLLAANGSADCPNVKILCSNSRKRTPLNTFSKILTDHLQDNHYDIVHSTLPLTFAHVYQPRGGSFHEAIIRNAASYDDPVTKCLKRLTHRTNLRRTALLKAEQNLCRKNNNTVIAALSEYVKTQFKKQYDLPDSRLSVIPNAVKTDIQIDRTKVNTLRTRLFALLGLHDSAEPSIILFAANNFRLKGLTPLIKALALLYKRQTSIPVYLAVAGSDKTATYKLLAEKLAVSNKIAFLGPLPNTNHALSLAAAAVLPTFYDPCSRFILEALALQKPVITTKFNGAAERFTDKRHGRILDNPDNIEALTDAIVQYTNPANAKNASNAILEDNLKDKISITFHAQQLIQLYESILNKTGVG